MFSLIAAVVVTVPSATELTIYNQGFGLIKETRTLSLKPGRQSVAVEDVAAMIEPNSVSVRSLSKDTFSVLEQNYQYDLISPTAILGKSIGGNVRFVRTVGGQREVLEGTLLSAPSAVFGDPRSGNGQTYSGMVIRTKDGRIILDPTGEIEVSDVPKGLISKPTLQWEVDADKGGETPVELSYISRGLNWNADYVLTLDGAGNGGLQGWVTLDNQSGATFENAKLKLLAGDVQRVNQGGTGGFGGGAAMRDAAVSMAKAFNEESLFEYHLYTLQRPATVRNRETKQISLLTSDKLPVTKRIIVDSVKEFGRFLPSEGEIGVGTIKPQVRVEFENKLEYGLGVPLPKGNVKVYQRDKSGSVQLLGEDAIDHTPRNEKLSLVVGRSFDIVANRKRTSYRSLGPNRVEETFEIEVRNRKETKEMVTVLERDFGDWTVTKKSQDFAKLDAFTLQFMLDLAPNESRTITYTIETHW